jgi:hypothetical protein
VADVVGSPSYIDRINRPRRQRVSSYPEPPPVGSEAETLLGSLERQRATFAYKCADLTAEQMRRTIGASQLTIAGLLKHLALMEDLNFTGTLVGQSLPSPWADHETDDLNEHAWRTATDDNPPELYALWERAVARSRTAVSAALTTGDPGLTFDVRPGVPCSLRRLLVDLIEEYARHTGHADLLREAIDGRVGEDPPGERYAYSLD